MKKREKKAIESSYQWLTSYDSGYKQGWKTHESDWTSPKKKKPDLDRVNT